VINNNLPRILHRFRDIAFDRAQIAIFCGLKILSILSIKSSFIPLLGLTPPTEGFPWDDLHKILCACQQMAKVPNAVEILPKILTAWLGRCK